MPARVTKKKYVPQFSPVIKNMNLGVANKLNLFHASLFNSTCVRCANSNKLFWPQIEDVCISLTVIVIYRAKTLLWKWVSMWRGTVHSWKLGVRPWQRLWGQLRRTRLWWACAALTCSKYPCICHKQHKHTLVHTSVNILAFFQSCTRAVQVHSSATQVTVSPLLCSVTAGLIVWICQTRPAVVSKQHEN